ncbi:unnamed protein product [Phaedon cochleariae]|uniref:BZIP domain-containing protein n=1 Tax=Phaedon cochleariae TaxID=80249 RepID=A0A9P0DKN1_PHACE|nr:unnamed protein product [Phaedon cochleariae]
MYNLNVDLAQSAANAVNALLVEGAATTPRTPEILNSLIAMTNPMDGYGFQGGKRKADGAALNMSSDSNSSSSSHLGSPTTTPPSVQHTCSQLIKAGLKLTIEQKRKQHSDCEDLLDLDKVSKKIKKNECSEDEEDDRIKQEHGIYPMFQLTPEDEERRRRRRERNKIAATKCRLKKRERTANLIQESEVLESQNVDLKGQLQELQSQKQTLMELLSMHRPHCQHNIGPATRDHLGRLPPVSVIESHPYSRPASVNPYRSGHMDTVARPASVGAANHLPCNRPAFSKLPSIIVEEVNENFEVSQFTNLDASYSYGSPCHNYSGSQGYGSAGMDNGCMA